MVNVLIYGAGAIGSFVGYLLSEIEENEDHAIKNVALLGRQSHIQRIKKSGLKINFLDGQKTFKFDHCFSGLEDLKRSNFDPDVVVICVKTYSLAKVRSDLRECGMLEGKLKDAKFILLMNGMGNREIFDMHLNVLEGITSIGVKFSEDGLIELKGKGKTVFEAGLCDESKRFMMEMFEEKGFEIEFAQDFKTHQWNKLFVNSVINPITALTRKHNGIVLSKHLENTVEKIVDECVIVAREEGFEFDKKAVLDLVYSIATKTSMNTSSMLQDILKGRITEIDSINGYVVRLAKKYSVPAPVNETLQSLVKSAEGRK